MSNLDGLRFYAEYTIDDIVCHNIISFMKYGLLEIGAYHNIGTGYRDAYGTDLSKLRPVTLPNQTDYTVWRGIKNDWIWESNISLKMGSGTQPYQPSGVLYNNTFTSTGHYIDYSRGQVVFTNALPSGSNVQIPYSVRGVHVYPTDSNEYRNLEQFWQIGGSGFIGDISYKSYMPAIFISNLGMKTVRGLELGSRGKVTDAQIQFEIYAGNEYELKKLMDICYMMEEKLIPLYNLNTAPKPLDYLGRLTSPSSTWPNLISNYRIGEGRFTQNANSMKIRSEKLPIHHGKVRINLQFDTYPS